MDLLGFDLEKLAEGNRKYTVCILPCNFVLELFFIGCCTQFEVKKVGQQPATSAARYTS
jgi:hypothetical protein